MAEGQTTPNDDGNDNYEAYCGLTLAVLAAVLAVVDLGAGKFGEDELIAHSEKAGAYLWYQSKGIKETLAEGQRDMLKALVLSGTIAPDKTAAVEALAAAVEKDADRYGKEKKEILLGSAKVGKENWVQDIGGEMGKVIGAKEWEAKSEGLNGAGDVFDTATLFLQLCLVVGAISLLMKQPKLRWGFFAAMVVMGLVGTVYGVQAYRIALAVP